MIKKRHRGGHLIGDDYAKAINGTKIALHFLRRENRDDQDSRTFEIPACGVFMLAERTPKHSYYFTEGVEAEFFDSFQELETKLRFYLENETKRQQVAAAGRKRSLTSDYSHEGRLNFILNEVMKLMPQGVS